MANNKEQRTKFLSSEEKVKALVNDEKFIGEVSGGTATSETYKEELEKFGVSLSDQDAKQAKNAADKVFEKSGEKLDDEFLKSISGGSAASTVAFVIGGASYLSGLGTSIAACVYMSKAEKAKLTGNNKDYDRYIEKTKNCGIATASLIGNGVFNHVIGNLVD